MDLIEMILSKCDMRIAALYDHQLADTEEEKALGVVLRGKYEETVKAVLEVKCSSCRASLHSFCLVLYVHHWWERAYALQCSTAMSHLHTEVKRQQKGCLLCALLESN